MVLSQNCSTARRCRFRFGDLLGSRRRYLSRADAAIVPTLVASNPTAGSAVSGLEDWIAAVRRRDLNGILTHHAADMWFTNITRSCSKADEQAPPPAPG
jgi:alkylation response protein AidB-like acyl-CoA dehydrogenase